MSELVQKLHALLPQTQCGECGFDGCRPYAEAIAQGQSTIDKCPPGGVETLEQLAAIMGHDATPFRSRVLENTRTPSVAKIVETECIGCTKCIQVCPVDAIIGSGKLMHTIIAKECTGCELCVPVCPTDCIEIVHQEQANFDKVLASHRFDARKSRLSDSERRARQDHISKRRAAHGDTSTQQDYIKAALERQQKKNPLPITVYE